MDGRLKGRLALIFGFVFIDLLGYSLILPLLPYYAQQYGASLFLVGLLGTSNSLAQFIAAPLIGRFSDRYGRRPLLIMSIAGTAISFLILGLAQSLLVIFISRIIDGFFGGNTALARAYITDVTDEENRSRGLGLIGAAFGLGFIFGPALGGFLSRWGFSVPAYLAAGLSLLNLIAVLIWLPESLSEERREAMMKRAEEKGPSRHDRINLSSMLEALQRAGTGPLLLTLLLYSLAFTLFTNNFALFTKTRLGLTAEETSYLLTYVGVLSVLVQGLSIGKLTDWLGERQVMAWGAVLLTLSLFAWSFVQSVAALIIVMTPLAVASGSLRVVLNSQLTKSVYKDEVGGTLGLSSSLEILSRIVTPGLGGFLFQTIGTWSGGVVAGALMAATTFVIRRRVLTISEEEMVGCRQEPSFQSAD